jgi:peptidoglycan/xylan/chitin deacetylase (PgdA/CDA1 family)
MTIQLVNALRIAGTVEAAGSQHTLSEALEADLIYQGKATRVGAAPDVAGIGVPVNAKFNPLNGVSVILDPRTQLPLIRKEDRIKRGPTKFPLNFNEVSSFTVANGAITLDTAKVRHNSPGSMKVVPSTASCTVNPTSAFATTASGGLILGTDTVVGLWVYPDSGDEANGASNAYINVTLANEFTFTNTVTLPFAANHLRWNQWNYLTMRLDEKGAWNAQGTGTSGVTLAGSGKVSAGFTTIQLLFGNMSGKTIYVDSLDYGLKARPSIIFGFDAIGTNQLTYGLPLMAQYDIPFFGTFNSAGGSPTNASHARTVMAAGAEIINHGTTHADMATFTTDAEVIAEVEPNWDAMETNGLVAAGQAKIFMYPQNSTDPLVKRVLAEQGYKWARGFKNFNYAETTSGFDGLFEVGAFDMGNPTSQKRLLDLLDAAWMYGCTTSFFVHDINPAAASTGPTGNQNTIYIDDLTAVVKKLANLRDTGLVDLYTPTQWYERVARLYS